MAETYSEGSRDEDGPLGRVGRLVARRWSQEDLEYDKLIARQNRPVQTEAGLARLQRDRGRILELEERKNKREQQTAPIGEAGYDPDDAVPKWMRDQWEEKAMDAGSTALGVALPEQIAADVQPGGNVGQEQLGLS